MRILANTIKIDTLSEEEAKSTIEAYRKDAAEKHYTIGSAGYVYKTKKSKGEIIGECWVVTISQKYGDLWEELE